MRTVAHLRNTLDELVPEAFFDRPDDEISEAGDYPAVQVWDPAGQEGGPLVAADKQPEAEVVGSPRFEFAAEGDPDVDDTLGSGLGEHVRRAALARGVDGLAWYLSFHMRGPQWGIYLPISSIVGLAHDLFNKTGLDLRRSMRLSAHVLHQHELFHFTVDYFTLLWELAHLHECWKPGRTLRRSAGYYEREEKLANAHMLRRINAVDADLKVRGRATILRKFVALQPAGYRDAPGFVTTTAFRAECERMCIDYAELANGGAT